MKKTTKIVLSITALSLITIHILNRLATIKAKKTIENTYESQNIYAWQFGQINYQVKGKGTPLLLLHNLNIGSSSRDFDKIVDKLKETHTVYTLDLLGYGKSEKPNIIYTNYLYTQLITDFIKEIITKRTDVLCVGDASGIIIPVCHNEESLINNIIMINPASINSLNRKPSKRRLFLKKLIDTPILGTMLYNIITSESQIKKQFENNYYYNPLNIEQQDIINYYTFAHYRNYKSKYSYSSCMCGNTAINIVHALKEINHNITIITGSDIENKDSINKDYRDINPAIDIIEIPVTKQYPHIENPETLLHHLSYILK